MLQLISYENPIFPPGFPSTQTVAGLLLSLLLTGCVSSNTVKNFNADREKYLLEEFDVASLSSSVRSPIEKAFVDNRKFNRVVLGFDVVETNNGVVKNLTLSETIYGRDHGLVLYQDEWAANDISYRVNNGNSLLGMMGLDIDSVFLNQTRFVRSPQDVIVKKIDSIEPSPVAITEGTDITLKYRIGFRVQFMNLNSFTWKFTFGQRFPASQINPAIQGDALDCEAVCTNDAGAVTLRRKFTYLLNYGFALTVQTSDASVSDAYSLKTVSFQ